MIKRRINITVSEHAKVPVYASKCAAGADLYSANEEDIVLQPNERKLIPTGICMEIPDDAEGCIRPRSGLSINSGLVAIMGTIDADYRGMVYIILHNIDTTVKVIQGQTRLAQIVFNGEGGLFQADWNIVDHLSDTERGSNGLGSTGKK